jgi:AcrR family transcriptional regulator
LSSMDEGKNTRRRGQELEDAILRAAMDELAEAGYAKLTMEAVASRAKTNKAAVYRRWAKRSELVIAAVRRYTPKLDLSAPDTGNLRDDMLTLLNRATGPIRALGIDTVRHILMERMGTEFFLPASRPGPGADQRLLGTIETIVAAARARGEVGPGDVKQQVLSLPFALVIYGFLTGQEPFSDGFLEEIVDEVFLPLVLKPR